MYELRDRTGVIASGSLERIRAKVSDLTTLISRRIAHAMPARSPEAHLCARRSIST